MTYDLLTARTPATVTELNQRFTDLDAMMAAVVPPASGLIVGWPSDTPPAHWLICNGQLVSRTTYADLFAAIGTTYGVGDGSSTFAVPDFRGRAPVLYGAGPDRTWTLGQQGGEETHALSIAELPAHTHVTGDANPAAYDTAGAGGFYAVNDATLGLTENTESTGGGNAHQNLQPSLVINFIIKV